MANIQNMGETQIGLLRWLDHHGPATAQHIAMLTCRTDDSIRKSLASLRRRGLVEVIRKRGNANVYQAVDFSKVKPVFGQKHLL